MIRLKKIEIIMLLVMALSFLVIVEKYYSTNYLDSVTMPIVHFIDKTKIDLELSGIKFEEPPKTVTREVVVLLYHGISDQPGEETVTQKQFNEQMIALKKNGYSTITLDDLYAFQRGEKSLLDKSLVITFDDGRKDSYYRSDTIFEALHFNAVMFVIVKSSFENPGNYYLNKKELHQMQDSGRWNLEAHSYEGHGKIIVDSNGDMKPFYANKKWLNNEQRNETDTEYVNRIRSDMKKAQELLQIEFQKPVRSFSLPFGDFGQDNPNKNIEKLAEEELIKIYDLVFYQFKPVIDKDYRGNFNDKRLNFYFINRIKVGPTTTSEKLLNELSASDEIYLPYIENYKNPSRWVNSWGTTVTKENELDISMSKSSDNAMVYLDGSYFLKNYSLKAIPLTKTGEFSLVFRFQNTVKYYSCNYTFEGHVSLVSVEGEYTKIIMKKKMDIDQPINDVEVVIINDTAQCRVNGSAAIEAQIPNIEKNGGVGFKYTSSNHFDIQRIVNIEIKSA